MTTNINQLLTTFLAAPQRPEGTLTFHVVQGFFYTLACSPEMITPSEWLPLIFNEQDENYGTIEEAETVLQALLELYNDTNAQVMTGNSKLDADISIRSPSSDNIGKDSALGQWANGFLLGHSWLTELWEPYIVDELQEDLDSSLMILTFFSSKRLAKSYLNEFLQNKKQTLDELADKMLDLFANAMSSYAHLGRSIQIALEGGGEAQQPYTNEHKIGRNDPCPCGSGKKYKKCCLH